MISPVCCHCGQWYQPPDGSAGRILTCGVCGRGVYIPYPLPVIPPPLPPPPPLPVSEPVVVKQAIPSYYPKSRLCFVVLGLFFGGLGLHNFYIGRSDVACVQLLLNLVGIATICVTFGLLNLGIGVWVLVEVVTIDRDVYGHRLV